jgi:hypothetical protein
MIVGQGQKNTSGIIESPGLYKVDLFDNSFLRCFMGHRQQFQIKLLFKMLN